MSDSLPDKSAHSDSPAGIPPLVEALRGLILQARQKVLSAANAAHLLGNRPAHRGI
jgi:hypothetical protein